MEGGGWWGGEPASVYQIGGEAISVTGSSDHLSYMTETFIFTTNKKPYSKIPGLKLQNWTLMLPRYTSSLDLEMNRMQWVSCGESEYIVAHSAELS